MHKFKHSRLALIVWTVLVMSVGYGFGSGAISFTAHFNFQKGGRT